MSFLTHCPICGSQLIATYNTVYCNNNPEKYSFIQTEYKKFHFNQTTVFMELIKYNHYILNDKIDSDDASFSIYSMKYGNSLDRFLVRGKGSINPNLSENNLMAILLLS